MSEKIDNWHSLPLHPYCEMIPQAAEDDYDELVRSMRDNGFLPTQAIVLTEEDDGRPQILDGRTRWQAAMDAGVDPVFVWYEGDDPLAYVLATNVARRHLTAGQKAALAKKIATLKPGDNQASEGVSQADAAKMMGTSKTSVAEYTVVENRDPALAKKVEDGEVTLADAYRKVKRGEGQRPEEAVPPSLTPDPDEKLGSQNMDFEKNPEPKTYKPNVTLDRGPFDDHTRTRRIQMVAPDGSVHRFTIDEAKALSRRLHNTACKWEDEQIPKDGAA